MPKKRQKRTHTPAVRNLPELPPELWEKIVELAHGDPADTPTLRLLGKSFSRDYLYRLLSETVKKVFDRAHAERMTELARENASIPDHVSHPDRRRRMNKARLNGQHLGDLRMQTFIHNLSYVTTAATPELFTWATHPLRLCLDALALTRV